MTASFNNEIKRLNANSQYPLCGKQQLLLLHFVGFLHLFMRMIATKNYLLLTTP